MNKTIRLSVGQAIVKFLDNQYVSFDNKEEKFVNGVFGIFGHGCVVGLGEALEQNNHSLKFYKGCNEQGMAHAAIAYAKQNNRKKIMAVTSSIGPGAMNMVTAAALATTNRIPVLLLPGDVFACRQPDPVLQQLEQFHDFGITSNDAFKPVCRYFDRIYRPEQIMSALIHAMRVLTSPVNTGAVCVALPQDVQGEAYDYPVEFFEKKVHYIDRVDANDSVVNEAIKVLKESKNPIMICGGGVRFSECGDTFANFASKYNIPFGETQAGKSAVEFTHPMNLGGIGVTGGLAANRIAKNADVVIAVGTRLSDFTTSSKWLFQNENVKIISINVNDFDAVKMDAIPLICDAKKGLEALSRKLDELSYKAAYTNEIKEIKETWDKEVDRLYTSELGPNNRYSQLRALGIMNEELFDKNSIVVGASGSLPGDMQRVWRAYERETYHMEYGYSCMGYEVSGSLGVKLAAPDVEVYSMVGDASFVMLHSELLTALENKIKINIMLFDNNGFGCIDNLQRSQGIPKFGCELVYRGDESNRIDASGKRLQVSYAMIAKGYGCDVWTVHNSEELRKALVEAKASKNSTLIDIKVDEDSMSGSYESWWRVGTPEVSEKPSVVEAYSQLQKEIKKTKKY
ncbi:MAG: 3D-(3,5/4)-trihydroxycyclohexane-1,2-dione acylhydrolase (decyclizing) [Pleomorphochaeta sp.]